MINFVSSGAADLNSQQVGLRDVVISSKLQSTVYLFCFNECPRCSDRSRRRVQKSSQDSPISAGTIQLGTEFLIVPTLAGEENGARHGLCGGRDRGFLLRLSAAAARVALRRRPVRLLHVQRPVREPLGLQDPRGQLRLLNKGAGT